MSQKLSEKWDRIGKEILGTARNELYLNMRFLDLALCSLQYQMDTAVRTAGCDGYVIHFEPYGLAEMFDRDRKDLNRLYLHMVLHCLFHHLTRKGAREEALWHLSCDIAAEAMIDGLKKRSVRKAVMPEREALYRMLSERLKVFTAEGVYHILYEQKLSNVQQEQLSDLFFVDDHSFWPKDEGDGRLPEALSALERHWQELADKMETEAETFGKDRETEDGDLFWQMKVQNQRRQDYRAFLRKFSVWREEMRVDEDSFDYGFYSYGLRLYGNLPLIEPQEFKETKKIQEFVIAVDTSMSCSGELVRAFLSETCGILFQTESFFKKVRIHIVQCDEKVQEDTVIAGAEELREFMEQFEVRGGGGTDFRPVFAHVEALRERGELKRLKGLLYFTDGRGIYPAKRPDYDVAFLFMKEDFTDVSVPAWAMKLILTETDLEKKADRLDKDIRFVQGSTRNV